MNELRTRRKVIYRAPPSQTRHGSIATVGNGKNSVLEQGKLKHKAMEDLDNTATKRLKKVEADTRSMKKELIQLEDGIVLDLEDFDSRLEKVEEKSGKNANIIYSKLKKDIDGVKHQVDGLSVALRTTTNKVEEELAKIKQQLSEKPSKEEVEDLKQQLSHLKGEVLAPKGLLSVDDEIKIQELTSENFNKRGARFRLWGLTGQEEDEYIDEISRGALGLDEEHDALYIQKIRPEVAICVKREHNQKIQYECRFLERELEDWKRRHPDVFSSECPNVEDCLAALEQDPYDVDIPDETLLLGRFFLRAAFHRIMSIRVGRGGRKPDSFTWHYFGHPKWAYMLATTATLMAYMNKYQDLDKVESRAEDGLDVGLDKDTFKERQLEHVDWYHRYLDLFRKKWNSATEKEMNLLKRWEKGAGLYAPPRPKMKYRDESEETSSESNNKGSKVIGEWKAQALASSDSDSDATTCSIANTGSVPV